MGAGARLRARQLGWVLLVAVGPWWCGPRYEAVSTPFAGSSWFNPYELLPSGGWLKVNLHAHGRAWGGLTAGAESGEALRAAYAAVGFDALGISNYFDRSPPAVPPAALIDLPVYEHGFNLTKSHRLVIGPREGVAFVDAPWLTRALKQLIIGHLSATAEAVALAHPSMRGGHDCDDLTELTDYALIEVQNPYATSLAEWDCALSAGHAVWALGGDDAHHAQVDYLGQAWTMVHAERTPAAIIDALKRGAAYAVRGEHGVNQNGLVSQSVHDGHFTLELEQPSSHVKLIGQGGRVLHEARDVSRVSYALKADDTYVRAVARTASGELDLNPVLRVPPEGSAPSTAELDVVAMLWHWGVWSAVALALWRRR